eukprot:CAMPEP_0169361722 /NCGR_PEP_ID=MMETSP1017-20121227/30508_1 /TAXON_ID=342587 /ORGANISM="Karlodinium micrum, Strain CCMP2283" /LENGTH=760 /DNA_ID=CAMNT_0009459157 /DNA_START=21 /DNA_END=2303 /DNA_ORIENTATION=+
MGAEEEPPVKKVRAEDGEAMAVKSEQSAVSQDTLDGANTEKKDNVKDKEKSEKKEKKDKSKKKDKSDKKAKDKSEKKEKKDIMGNKENIDTSNKEGKEGKEKKEKKVKGEKKEKKDKRGKKEKKDKGKEKKSKKHEKDKNDKKGKVKKVVVIKKKIGMKGKMGKFGQKAALKKKEASAPKVLLKTEDDYEPVNRWWERDDGALSGKRGAKKWDTFEHHGLLFAPDYEPHGQPLIYDGKPVVLPVEAEEVGTYWSACKGSDYEEKEVFIKNFWDAFTQRLPEKFSFIKDFKKCDWSKYHAHRESERIKRLERSKEEKERLKKEADDEVAWYAHSIVDGVRERLGNFRLEPPSLFRGRGEHPKQGMLKKRTFPEHCIMNIGEDAPVPQPFGCPGHAWKDVVHEHHVQWIAAFEDGVLGDMKYVSFAATSGLKGQPDMLKYDRARRLLGVVDKIRDSYTKLQQSKSLIDRQKATVTYIIDRLALRVGGEKDTEEEADTVGCCSLRVEHIKLEEPDLLHLNFLGKDSIRYENTVHVTEQVWKNLKEFSQGKKPTENLFEKVTPSVVNEYFKEFMDDLSAKVFRTFNASNTLQQELAKFDMSKKDQYSQDMLLKFYNDANRQVAILCNHQKAVSKSHQATMEKMEETKKKMESDIKIYKKHLAHIQDSSKPAVNVGDMKLPRDDVGCKKKIAELKMRLEKHINNMNDKEDNKLVSLGTSKVNYMDPRITVSWCKKVDLAIERVFSRTIRTKFPWAMHFGSTYKFD